jgi:hypothetical protein
MKSTEVKEALAAVADPEQARGWMLRYAIEKLPETQRKHYLKAGS